MQECSVSFMTGLVMALFQDYETTCYKRKSLQNIERLYTDIFLFFTSLVITTIISFSDNNSYCTLFFQTGSWEHSRNLQTTTHSTICICYAFLKRLNNVLWSLPLCETWLVMHMDCYEGALLHSTLYRIKTYGLHGNKSSVQLFHGIKSMHVW